MTKTVLITGATAGFGAASARLFAKNGWNVIGTGRRADRLQDLKDELGDAFHAAIFDITDEDAMLAAIAALPEKFKGIDLLINNAGLALGTGPAPTGTKLSEWKTMISTNVTALVTITHHLLPTLIERKGGIINLASVASTYPYSGGNVYGGTKAFVRQFSLGLRSDLSKRGVRVTSIEPGLAESEFSLVRFHGDRDRADAVYRGTQPLTPADIAEIVQWVTSVPPHVNICSVEVMPVCQGFGPLAVHRQGS